MLQTKGAFVPQSNVSYIYNIYKKHFRGKEIAAGWQDGMVKKKRISESDCENENIIESTCLGL